jgi:2-iminobutanoate/2-iminopropanoate deaminase
MLERVSTGQAAGAYSSAVVTEGRLAFISGHGPLVDGNVVRGTIEEETALTLTNLLQAIEAAGGRKEGVVRCLCFLSDIANFSRFDAAYRQFFGELLPARSTIQAALYDGIQVEIEAIVALD